MMMMMMMMSMIRCRFPLPTLLTNGTILMRKIGGQCLTPMHSVPQPVCLNASRVLLGDNILGDNMIAH